MTAVVIFILTYAGVALGRLPGLAIDRVGIALLGAIAMIVSGILSLEQAAHAIDLPTILLLYALMIISAQLRLGGFYTWATGRIIPLMRRPEFFLGVMMVISAVMSAILANDIICFALTPVLTVALLHAGLNPLPFLLGLAMASNIGSAATIIGNPQNILIGQTGHLDFGSFLLWCAPPSILSLAGCYLILWFLYRNRLFWNAPEAIPPDAVAQPAFDLWHAAKGLLAVAALIGLFFTSVPRELSALGVAGILLCSRKMRTREILGLIDWHLLTLFCSLFIVIEGLRQTTLLSAAAAMLSRHGISLTNHLDLTIISVLGSNLVSNVPATMILIPFLDPADPVGWYTLALSSTFAGNLFIVGSIANLIVIEQAERFGIKISFTQHVKAGIPVTLLSLSVLALWIRF